jgi:two-component system, OmpR family, response regulator MprA
MSHILVINDDEAVRTTIGKILQLDDHDISLAANRDRGVAQIWKQNFDLVICDTIATIEGLETVCQIRALSADLPIVSIIENTMTTDASAPAARDILGVPKRLGPTRTLAKPFTGREFLALVRELLRSESQ